MIWGWGRAPHNIVLSYDIKWPFCHSSHDYLNLSQTRPHIHTAIPTPYYLKSKKRFLALEFSKNFKFYL